MEDKTPFDLDDAIRNWRDSLIQSSRLRMEELEELESHLRDSVGALEKRGLSEEEAWLIAERRVGQREILKQEFAKVTSPARALIGTWERLAAAMHVPAPEASQILRRIILTERDVVLPAKVVAVGILFFSFYSSPWFTNVSSELEIGVEVVQNLLWGYVGINLLAAGILFFARRVPLRLLEWTVFAMTLLDGIFMLLVATALAGVEGTYWLFLALLARSALSVPRLSSQILLGAILIALYVLAYVVENSMAHNLQVLGPIFYVERGTQPLVLRLALLTIAAACCYGVQILLYRNQSQSTRVPD